METAIPIKDAELLEGLRADSPEAFEQLFNCYWKDLYQRAYQRLRNQSEAEDMVQDILSGIWERRHSLVITTSLQSYLHTALKYQVIKWVGKVNLHNEATKHLLSRMDEIEATILDTMMAKDVKRTMDEAVESFPPNMRQIFVLRAENYTISEIAEALGLAQQTVKNNHTESLRRLKVILTERHPDINKSFFAILLLLIKS